MTNLPALLTVDSESAGQRLDQFLSASVPELSRAILQRAIKAGGVLVNGAGAKRSTKLRDGDRVEVRELATPPPGPEPQAIPIDVLYEDEHLAVINKEAGMIVHPARGHWDGTLASAVAYHFGQLSELGGPTRPGIVHRLDRDTSGAIVIAKNDQIHAQLAEQFKARTVEKQYLAIVVGTPDRDNDMIDAPIGDHPSHREKKAIRAGHTSSRDAQTFYTVEERFAGFALVNAHPKTGRTHQIRLHFAHVGHPVLCDRLYGSRSEVTAGQLNRSHPESESVVLRRQALHARRLTITHPVMKSLLQVDAPIPQDIAEVLSALRG